MVRVDGDGDDDGFYAGEGVGDHVVLSGNVSHVCGELRNEVQVVKLPW
jgi:hypothetical protein